MEAAQKPLWGEEEEGKEVEWTDFGTNELFAVKSAEKLPVSKAEERRGRRKTKPEQEIRLTKSGPLHQKNRERMPQLSQERLKQIGEL